MEVGRSATRAVLGVRVAEALAFDGLDDPVGAFAWARW